MLLSARMLDSVSDANNYQYLESIRITEGDTATLYFQLVDMNKDRIEQGFVPAGRRFVPSPGSTLSVTFDSIDNARKVTRSAIQPFPEDPSIWSVGIISTDPLRGTVNMRLAMTQSGVVTNGLLQNALGVVALDGMTRV